MCASAPRSSKPPALPEGSVAHDSTLLRPQAHPPRNVEGDRRCRRRSHVGRRYPAARPGFAAQPEGDFAPNAFVRIGGDGKVTFTIPQVEMAQGVYTSLSMILAEELAVVGDHMWAAKEGLEALDVTWDEGPNANVSTSFSTSENARVDSASCY